MAVNFSPRKQQEAGQTPAEFHLSSSYSTLVTSLIQQVKAGEMLRERPHVLVYMCMNWKEQRPEGSGAERVLGVQTGQAEQALASAQAPRSACSPESMCPVLDMSLV